MNNHFFVPLLVCCLFSLGFCSLPEDDDPIPCQLNEIAPDCNIPSMELSLEELQMIIENPNDEYVYVSRDASDCFNAIPYYPNMPMELKNLKDHIVLNRKAVPFVPTLNAVTQALHYYKSHWQPVYRKHWKALQAYQKDLEIGAAKIVMEDIPTRSGKCKSSCSLFVRDCAKVGSLSVCANALFRQNVNIQGNLEVANDIRAQGNLSTPECVAVGKDICAQGNMVFNAPNCGCPLNFSNGALFVKGARECLLKNVRGTVDLSGALINETTVTANVMPVAGANVGYVVGNLSGLAVDVSNSFGQPGKLVDATFLVTLTDHPSSATQLSTALTLELANTQALVLANVATIASLQVVASSVGTNAFTVRIIILAFGNLDMTIDTLLTNVLNNLSVHFIVEDRVVPSQCSSTLNCNLPCQQ